MSHPSALSAPPPAPADRRDAPRHACRIETEYYALSESLSRPRLGCVVNVSTTGLTLVAHAPIGRHTLIGVALHNAARTRSLLLVGRVIRALAYGDDWLVGCAFDRPLTHDELENLL
jgi:hypothetical protein